MMRLGQSRWCSRCCRFASEPPGVRLGVDPELQRLQRLSTLSQQQESSLGAEVGAGDLGVQRPRIWSPDPDFAPDLLQAAAAGELPGVELQIPINRFRLAIFASKSGSDLTNCSM